MIDWIIFDICSFEAQNRVFEFGYQKINWCSIKWCLTYLYWVPHMRPHLNRKSAQYGMALWFWNLSWPLRESQLRFQNHIRTLGWNILWNYCHCFLQKNFGRSFSLVNVFLNDYLRNCTFRFTVLVAFFSTSTRFALSKTIKNQTCLGLFL